VQYLKLGRSGLDVSPIAIGAEIDRIRAQIPGMNP
jgi:hypothetical protein